MATLRPRVKCAAMNSLGFHCGHWAMDGIETCQFHTSEKDRIALAVAREDAYEISRTNGFQPKEFDPEDIKDAASFAKAVLETTEFQNYILQGLTKRDIPPTVLLRLMDYAEGWGKPTEKVEHTGQTPVTEVRRVIVHPTPSDEEISEALEDKLDTPLPVDNRRMH